MDLVLHHDLSRITSALNSGFTAWKVVIVLFGGREGIYLCPNSPQTNISISISVIYLHYINGRKDKICLFSHADIFSVYMIYIQVVLKKYTIVSQQIIYAHIVPWISRMWKVCKNGKKFTLDLCQYPLADPSISGSLNHSWLLESSSGFSHLRPGVFHISLLIRKAQQRGWKKRTNKQTRTWVSSKRRRGKSVTLLCILWANASVYSSENTHKATSNADLSSRVGQPIISRSTGTSSRLSDLWLLLVSFCSLLLTVSFSALLSPLSIDFFSSPLSTGIFCSLLLTASFPWLTSHADFLCYLPSLVYFRSPGRSRAQALCVGFTLKLTKGFSDWHPHAVKRMSPIVSQIYFSF